MASSVSPPWIHKYFLDVAEIHGGDLPTVSASTKPQKVQLIKFLTHELPGGDNWIWATVSDLTNKVFVRFTKRAMKAFREHDITKDHTFTAYKTALISIKQFHPMFARVPNSDGMSREDHLVLEIDSFTTLGSYGANVWKSPVDVETVEDIRLWVQGMRAGSGGGNILKMKRIEREQASGNAQAQAKKSSIFHASPPRTQLRKISTDGSESEKPVLESQSSRITRSRAKGKKVDFIKAHKRSWSKTTQKSFDVLYDKLVSAQKAAQVVRKNARAINPTVLSNVDICVPRTPRRSRNALDFSSSSPSSSPKPPSLTLAPRSRDAPGDEHPCQSTPSNWSPSEYGGTQKRTPDSDDDAHEIHADRIKDPTASCASEHSEITLLSPGIPVASLDDNLVHENVAMEVDKQLEEDGGDRSSEASESPSTSYLGPTPAQRPQPKISFSSSLPTPGRVLVPDSTQQPLSQLLSSPPPFSPAKPSQDSQSLIPGITSDSGLKSNAPQRPTKVPQNRAFSGVISNWHLLQGRILVPNSDTSGTTASQSQPSQQLQDAQNLVELSHNPLLSLEHAPGQGGTRPHFIDGQSLAQEESQESQDLEGAHSLSYVTLSQSQSKPRGESDPVLSIVPLQNDEVALGNQAVYDISPTRSIDEGRPNGDDHPRAETSAMHGEKTVAVSFQDQQWGQSMIQVEAGRKDLHESLPQSPHEMDERGLPPSHSDDNTEPEDEGADGMQVDDNLSIRCRSPSPLYPEDIEAMKQEEEESQSQSQPAPDPAKQLEVDSQHQTDVNEGKFDAKGMDSDDERIEDALRVEVSNEASTEPPKRKNTLHPDSCSSVDQSSQINLIIPSADTSATRRLLHGIKRLFSAGPSSLITGASPQAVPPSPETLLHKGSHVPSLSPSKNKFHDAEAWRQPSFMHDPSAKPAISSEGSILKELNEVVGAQPAGLVKTSECFEETARPVHQDPVAISQRSDVVPERDPLRKRRAPSNSSESNESTQPKTVKRRRIVSSEPVSVPSSPETTIPKVVIARPDPPPASKTRNKATVKIRHGSRPIAPNEHRPPPRTMRDETENVLPAARSPNATWMTKVGNTSKPIMSSRTHESSSKAVPEVTSPPTLSEKARGKQPVRSLDIFGTRGAAAATQTFVPAPPAASPAKHSAQSRPVKKLGGAKLDLSMAAEDMNGLHVTWAQLDAGLLRVGRLRYKERKVKLKRKPNGGM